MIYMFKKKKLCGGDSAYPFFDVNWGRLCLDRTSYVQVHSSPRCEIVRFEKGFSCIFPAMSTRCIAAGCSKTTKDGVSLQVFSSAVQQTLRAVVLRESEIHYTFWHEEESSLLKHDAIQTIFPASGEVKEGTWKT